jgi:iron complex transport system ATP-binding protein
VSGARLDCRDLTVTLGDRAVLDGVSLGVAAGEWVAVVGPNGAGKTTLLRAVLGLVPTSGTVAVDGEPLDGRPGRHRARRVALVPQTPVVPVGMAVVDYVLLGRTPHLGPAGRERPEDLAVVHEVLCDLDLLPFATRALGSLSGGERQRVCVARALAQRTPVVLFDEPTSSLDLGHQVHVLELVDELRRRAGLAVVTTMHDLTMAGRFADRLLLLARGRAVADGPPAEVLTAPRVSALYGTAVRVVVDEDGTVLVLPQRRGAAPGAPSAVHGPVPGDP